MTRPAQDRRPRKLATLLTQRVLAAIREGGLAPGMKLPPEKEMIEEYGVSRGTLREALRFLELQGVISMKTGPGGGPVVAPADVRPLASVIALLLERYGGSFSSIVQAREFLEPPLAAIVAERDDDEALASIAATIDDMRAHLDDFPRFLEDNDRFHAAVARASGNEVCDIVLTSLSWITDRMVEAIEEWYTPRQRLDILAAHEQVYEAIAAHDPAAAADAMRRHLRSVIEHLNKTNPRFASQPVRWEQVIE